MGSSSSSRNTDTFLDSKTTPGKPKGLMDAYSEIQFYFKSEREGSTAISGDFLTLAGKMAFFEVGFKGAFVSGLISALLTPLAIGVIEKNLPIFGSYEPTSYDQCFAFIIAIGFTVGYSMFFGSLGKFYIGEITKSAIKNLLQGVVAGAIIKMIIAFLAFHFLYFVVTEPHYLAGMMLKMRWLISYTTLNKLYSWLQDFRPVFLLSSYFVVFTTALLIILPIVGVYRGSRKTGAIMTNEKLWK